ncbi:MAG: hypothetical protein FJ272_03875 [Planctomycetes bacterium]|nr:hypothetical protein [Planctomycetota bacterium]
MRLQEGGHAERLRRGVAVARHPFRGRRRQPAALNPGGLILIQDFVLNEARTAPVSNALFALNMLVNTPAGRTYTAREIGGWLKKAGFRNVRKLPMEMPREAGIVCGRKPR